MVHPAPEENPTRGTHALDGDTWAPVESELPYAGDIHGTASLLAMTHWQLMHSAPSMPNWPWMCGPDGYRPEMGVAYVYAGGPCTSTNKSCHCWFCQAPTITGHCVCPRHNPESDDG